MSQADMSIMDHCSHVYGLTSSDLYSQVVCKTKPDNNTKIYSKFKYYNMYHQFHHLPPYSVPNHYKALYFLSELYQSLLYVYCNISPGLKDN